MWSSRRQFLTETAAHKITWRLTSSDELKTQADFRFGVLTFV
jgi:hypothetical protein